MAKSKVFWAGAALLSFCAAALCGYSIYTRLTLHFSKDTLEIKSVPMPAQAETAQEAETPGPPETAGAAPQAPEDHTQKAANPAVKEELRKAKAVKTRFEYKNAAARSVLIAGSFTRWKELKLAKKGGVWSADVYIFPGNYIFHYTVDGKKTLAPDKPTAVGESIVEVSGGGAEPSAPENLKPI